MHVSRRLAQLAVLPVVTAVEIPPRRPRMVFTVFEDITVPLA